MGKGIDAARSINPEGAALIEDMKEQLLLVFLRRLGGSLTIPVAEIDDTAGLLFAFSVDVATGEFYFELQRKQ